MPTSTKRRERRNYLEALKGMKAYEIVEKETEENPAEGRLRCPKSDCRGEFVVHRKQWKKLPHAGRACPYCFRASRVPGRHYQEEIDGVIPMAED